MKRIYIFDCHLPFRIFSSWAVGNQEEEEKQKEAKKSYRTPARQSAVLHALNCWRWCRVRSRPGRSCPLE